MNKIYNTQEEIASAIKDFLMKVDAKIRLTQLKIIPFIIVGMILSESSVKLDIAKNLKGDFSQVQLSSVTKRISRFFKNKLFSPYDFYDKIIRFIINNYKKKHDDKRVHIIFDHIFSHDNFTVFMITMRVGKQGIPLWFRCFKGNNDSNAFQESLLKDGISYVSSLFSKDFDLIFLADRWFNSTSLMEHIDSLGHTFNLRLKKNMKILVYDKKERHKIWKTTGDLFAYEYHSNYFNDIELTESKFKVNIAISKKQDVSEPWIIATNGDVKRAIKDYSYRFGGIESLFKNQKSNGFYMESICNASIEYFTSMYTMVCFASLFLTILGADFTKNSKCYREVKIQTHTIINGIKKRVMSLFNTGLTLFNIAYNSSRYIRLPFNFILYDI
jgi:hypothetical protein